MKERGKGRGRCGREREGGREGVREGKRKREGGRKGGGRERGRKEGEVKLLDVTECSAIAQGMHCYCPRELTHDIHTNTCIATPRSAHKAFDTGLYTVHHEMHA